MKSRIYLILFSLFLGINSMAQNSDECAQNLSIFAENAKVKNYGAAYEPWSLVRKECPDLNIAIYAYGERILKERLKNSSENEKSQRETDLIDLYNDWAKYFPTKKGRNDIGNILSAKAQTMIDFKIGSDSEIYSIFDDAFKRDIKSFSNPKRLYNYFKILYEIYKRKNESVTPEKLFEKYEDVSEKFEFESIKLAKNLDILLKKEESGEALTTKDLKNKRIYGVNSNAISIYLKNLDAIISKESSCENLIPLYERNFDQNRENIIWLKKRRCISTFLYLVCNKIDYLPLYEPSSGSFSYCSFTYILSSTSPL